MIQGECPGWMSPRTTSMPSKLRNQEAESKFHWRNQEDESKFHVKFREQFR